MKTRLLFNRSQLLACAGALLLFATPIAVQGQFTYITTNGTISITGYTGPGGAVNIPAQINGLPVVSIGRYAFYYQTSLTNITIPNSVTSIGEAAFFYCRSLISLAIGSGVTNIAHEAFAWCTGLPSVELPGSITTIGPGAFWTCTSLTTVIIPSGVTNIGAEAFAACLGLSAISVATQNPAYTGLNGVLFNKNQTTLVQFPAGLDGAYTIPNSVTNVGDYAFESCYGLNAVTIPNSVTRIGNSAFAYCGANVSIGSSVSYIGVNSFFACQGLVNVTIPNSVTYVDFDAFSQCRSLLNVTIGDNVTSLGGATFASCSSLTNVAIGGALTNLPYDTFSQCSSLMAITVSAQNPVYSSLGGVLFDKGQTTLILFPEGLGGNYTVPDSVLNIGDTAFIGCTRLTDVTIGDNVTNIGDGTFELCSSLSAITVGARNPAYSSVSGVLLDKSQSTLICFPAGLGGSYSIPDGVADIRDDAFAWCTNLTSVTVPSSVTHIGDFAFGDCTGLTAAFFMGDAPSADPSVWGDFETFYSDPATVYYLPGTLGWSNTFAGLPTALWLPRVQTGDTSFGVRSNQFGFNTSWASGQTVVVEAATNLSNPVWIPVATNTLTGTTSYFSDAAWADYPQRFYRVLWR